jgi:hypothetical protein
MQQAANNRGDNKHNKPSLTCASLVERLRSHPPGKHKSTMAARNSCTHMTWSEAKSKDGGNTGGGGAKKRVSKKVPHDVALTAKVIAKHGGSSQTELANQRRKARREEEKLMAAEVKRTEQRERERLEHQFIKPFQQAQDRLQALTEQAISEELRDTPKLPQPVTMDTDQLAAVCEWKEMQLNEIMALEAMLYDSDQFFVTAASRAEELRAAVEDYQNDLDNAVTRQAVVGHPPMALVLKHTIMHESQDLAASFLLQVTYDLPSDWQGDDLTLVHPSFRVKYCMVTDTSTIASVDKPLESLAFLEERELLKAMREEVTLTLPDPCVYQVAVTWLEEHLFSFLTLR